jgi:hypothetical protein
MAEITVNPVSSDKDMQDFLSLPAKIMADNPMFVPPLEKMVRDQLNPKKNPWFQHGVAELFLARSGGVPVGRLSAQIDYTHNTSNAEKTGFFGFFDCFNHQLAVDKLFSEASDWLIQRGMTSVRGPFSLNINEQAGLLIKGFNSHARMMMGQGQPYYKDLIEKNGFRGIKDLFAYLTPMDTAYPKRNEKLLSRIRSNTDLTFRHLETKNYERDIAIVVKIFNEAWNDNWGFIKMSQDDVRHMARQLQPLIIPELIWFAFYKGEPAAMAVALPDLNEIIFDLGGKLWPFGWIRFVWRLFNRRTWCSRTRIPLMGVTPRFQRKAFGSLLSLMVVGAIRDESLKLNLPLCEMSWILEENDSVRHAIEELGGYVYKTYRVYERTL